MIRITCYAGDGWKCSNSFRVRSMIEDNSAFRNDLCRECYKKQYGMPRAIRGRQKTIHGYRRTRNRRNRTK
jgi:hypothetical protein